MSAAELAFEDAFGCMAGSKVNEIPVPSPISIVYDSIRNTKVDFFIPDVDNGNQDHVYTTSIKVLKDVVESIGIDIDSLYGTSRCFRDTLMVLRCIKTFDMPLNFSTEPAKNSRLTIAYEQQGRNSRKINLIKFKLHYKFTNI